jgi:hypothetical protein
VGARHPGTGAATGMMNQGAGGYLAGMIHHRSAGPPAVEVPAFYKSPLCRIRRAT